ncbi:CPBP family intramembrane glutamic endopeptidase [Actinoplanes regularis]|uniref:CAAX protease self-immunity n=1 Tax=Actinoplanes regularis TaxID=52697 RepID=A0A238Y631_9ACTN|nr:CPBP family intramembrane glutamic endopeptidase [Actinoplanes regularis]GIE86180.1 hypothetical protein Are01nite_26600 [Actinoplanes regularis]SNR66278.1 CAAX protease self-immunity [Actinoplanes regularis]
MTPLILSVVLILMLLADAILGAVRARSVLAALAAAPANRVRFYRRALAVGWVRAAMATLVALIAGLSLTEIGMSGPGGGPTGGAPNGWLLAWSAAILIGVSTGVGAVRIRRAMRAGRVFPKRARIAPLIPRTTGERRYAAALSVTAGITEEIVFRGALIALGIEVFHLPVPVIAALSLVLFAAFHAYQGRAGVLNAGVLGLWFTGLTLLAGSILPAIVLHIVFDLWAFLVVPAEPTPRPAEVVPADTGERVAPLVDTPPPSEEGRTDAPSTIPAIRSPIPAG